MRTLSKVFGMFGKDLGCDVELKNGEKKRISIFKPTDFAKKSIMSGASSPKDPFAGIDKV